MKTVLTYSLLAGLAFSAASAPASPAEAQQNITGRALVEVCLPYATRGKSFEKAIRAARELRFRRPASERNQPLEEFASEVNLISQDGTWWLRLEEGTIEDGETQIYTVTCALSSSRASARELTDLGHRAFGNERFWSTDQGPRQWDRRTRDPDQYRLEVRVVEEDGARPALTIRGLYY